MDLESFISRSDSSMSHTSVRLPVIVSKQDQRRLRRINSSLISVDRHSLSSSSETNLSRRPRREFSATNRMNDMTNERLCSLTQMLFIYAQKGDDNGTNETLHNILNVLELHFNTYADVKQRIFFEGIFQILHDFNEQIPELVLIETIQKLQLDPFAPMTFDDFILILCHVPRYPQDHHVFLDVFNELDHNKDSYITFDDIRFVLPHLTTHFDEEILQAAIHTIDTDHDNDRLSYFDFVTSLIALQECQSLMKIKTTETVNNGL